MRETTAMADQYEVVGRRLMILVAVGLALPVYGAILDGRYQAAA